MQTHLGHIQFNVKPANLGFYKDLMRFLGWQALYDAEDMLGVAGKSKDSLWFVASTKEVANDYDGPGVNHIGIGTATKEDVDATVAFLRDHGVEPLFETPRHRPEWAEDISHTYYQVMFD